MDTLMNKQTCHAHLNNMIKSSPSSSTLLSMSNSSQTISKPRPKIRIIHIFAPEIIKTDAANFRELVQRLTGKPTEEEAKMSKRKRAMAPSSSRPRKLSPTTNKKMEVALRAAGFREMIKGEEEIWRGANSGGGFLDQFDGFMQEINDQYFPFLEGTPAQMDAYGSETVQLAN